MLQLLLIVPLLGALYLIDVYIQPIGLVLVKFSELFNPEPFLISFLTKLKKISNGSVYRTVRYLFSNHLR